MSKKWILIFFIEVYCLSHPAAFAGVQSLDVGQRFVATLSGGPAWYQAGETQTFYLQPGFQNTYVANTPTQILASGELFLGLQRNISSAYDVQLGFAVATSSDAYLQGNIWELANPRFDNFSYQYKESHTHIAVKGKILTDILGSGTLPYASGSLGYAFNRAYGFSMTPLIFQALAEPLFQSNTQNAFTYTVGAGLMKAVNQYWQVGLGYEFADWGRSALNPSSVQTMNQGITLNHLYTNQLQFSLTYLS